jgi:Na+-transporting methylmalonyl-CoA/oxaloacetate decarboxylase beta subunit
LVTTGGKVVIIIGVIVMFLGLAFASNPLIIMFMFFAGIVTIIQGARMKPLASTTAGSTRRDISDSGSHYNAGLGIKKDPKNKGAI